MNVELASFYQQILHLTSAPLIQQLVSFSEVRKVGKRVVFHQSGKVQTTVDILLHGLVRGFFLDRAEKRSQTASPLSPHAPGVRL